MSYQTFDRYKRRTFELDAAIGRLFIAGVSTRKLAAIVEELFGAPLSPQSVSEVAKHLDEEVAAFHAREIADTVEFLFLDGISKKLREIGLERKVMLCAFGIHTDGTKELLDFCLAQAESTESWEAFLTALKSRGIAGERLRLVTTDGDGGLIAAVERIYPEAPRQRCIAHVSRNVITKCRERNKAAVGNALSAIWAARSKEEALQAFHLLSARFRTEEERAVRGLERVIDSALIYHDFPQELWPTLRTTNALERSFREVRRRTRAMGEVFVNEASLDRIFYAVIQQMNESWRRRPLEAIPTI